MIQSKKRFDYSVCPSIPAPEALLTLYRLQLILEQLTLNPLSLPSSISPTKIDYGKISLTTSTMVKEYAETLAPTAKPKLTNFPVQKAKVDNDPYLQLVHDKLSHIFRQKGAIRMDSPLLMPTSQVYASRKPVRLLDSDGTIVCLPFHLNITFCTSLYLPHISHVC